MSTVVPAALAPIAPAPLSGPTRDGGRRRPRHGGRLDPRHDRRRPGPQGLDHPPRARRWASPATGRDCGVVSADPTASGATRRSAERSPASERCAPARRSPARSDRGDLRFTQWTANPRDTTMSVHARPAGNPAASNPRPQAKNPAEAPHLRSLRENGDMPHPDRRPLASASGATRPRRVRRRARARARPAAGAPLPRFRRHGTTMV